MDETPPKNFYDFVLQKYGAYYSGELERKILPKDLQSPFFLGHFVCEIYYEFGHKFSNAEKMQKKVRSKVRELHKNAQWLDQRKAIAADEIVNNGGSLFDVPEFKESEEELFRKMVEKTREICEEILCSLDRKARVDRQKNKRKLKRPDPKVSVDSLEDAKKRHKLVTDQAYLDYCIERQTAWISDPEKQKEEIRKHVRLNSGKHDGSPTYPVRGEFHGEGKEHIDVHTSRILRRINSKKTNKNN